MNPITFTPANSVTIGTAAGSYAMTYDMPPVDPTNPDVQVTNTSATTAYIAFHRDAQVGHEVPGVLSVKSMQSALITRNPEVLAHRRDLANVTLPQGRYTPSTWLAEYAGAVAAATECRVLTEHPGGSVTITRGTAGVTTTY